ncbi:S-layer homology domain-containing protein [Salibacterium halotolerans]|uniref:S-layer homology domain-containing protein n=1 Tax=Salibacterium halotolerans TaxID=1884432 RepID=A0A1I5L031_9BACI|nr:S-layer homology domain-containing protein [Salibacterium halotolerans]SFO90513.1 S-layer homology domain-containing protein [Salibacterium halotolerans]
MAYQPRTYRKFLAGSVSAAMVAAAGAAVPADVQHADAAESFPDIDNDYWASDSIQKLAEDGVISGYPNGEYRPGEEINRGQVAAMLSSAFNLDVNENAEAPFDDLSDDSYFTPVAAAVKEAGLIRGRQNNTEFAAGMDLSREQMATILVRAFNLDEKEDAEADVADLDEVHESHRGSVRILSQYDITDTANNMFRPDETVTRAQFAVFLDRAMQIGQDEEEETTVSNVEAVNNTTVEVSFNGSVEGNIDADHFSIDPSLDVVDAETIAPEDSEASQNAEGTVVRLTTEEQTDDEEYSLSYDGEDTGMTFTGGATQSGDITVDDVSVQSTTSFNINLDEALNEDWDSSDVEEMLNISVMNEDDEETDVTPTNVEISDDRETIMVEHADNDLEGMAGTLMVNNFEMDFDYSEINVDSVEATTSTIRQAEDQQLEFTVNGIRHLSVEELEDAGYEVEFLYNSNNAPFDTDQAQQEGVIDGTSDNLSDTFRYAVSVTDEDGNEVESEEMEVDVSSESDVTEVTEVALFNDSGSRYEEDYVTPAQEGMMFEPVTGTNDFGDEVNADEASFPAVESVTSSDASIAYYNEDGLQVTGEGDVTFSVHFEGMDNPVEYNVEVLANQEISSMEADETTKRYTTNSTSDTFTVLDQYDQPYGNDEEISYTITDSDGSEVTSGSATVNSEGKLDVSYPDNLEGEYEVEFTYDNETIGTTTLEFVQLDSSEVDEFSLSTEPESVDLQNALEGGSINQDSEEIQFTVSTGAMYDGINLSNSEIESALSNLNDSGSLQVRSSDEDVATVASSDSMNVTADEALDFNVTGQSEGTAEIYLEHVEGDFTTTLAQVEVEVENSISQIDSLELADDVDALDVSQDSEGTWQIDDISQLTSSDAQLSADMIASVAYSPNDEQAVVELKEAYGGQSFVVSAMNTSS